MKKIIRGKVRRGDRRGHQLGFPTANINLHQAISDGVYIALTKVNNQWHEAMVMVGTAPTFNRNKRYLEAHLIDFNKNLYGKWISIKLIKRIHPIKKYKTASQLKIGLKKYKQEVKKYFNQKQ
ncbi:riboflavin kinase [Patescibacteria group bacterium]